MNDAQHRALQNYLDEVKPLLLLGDWEIWAEREKPSSRAWARVEVSEARDTAWVYVAWPEFFDTSTRDEQRLYLTHELVHIVTAPLLQVHQTFLDREGDRESVQVYKTEHNRGLEIATHKLARLLAATIPKPRFPRTEEDRVLQGDDATTSDWFPNEITTISPPNANIAGLYVDPIRRS